MPTKFNTFTNNFDLVNSLDSVVVGPGVSTDNAIARFDGTTGKLLQNSGSTLSDTDVLSTGELNLTTDLAVEYGGTGASTLTDGGILLGSGTSAVTVTDQPTNGQLLVGSTGSDPVLTTLTEGANITITNAAGSITIASTGGGDMPEVVLGGLAASHQVNTTTSFAPVSYRDFGSIEMLVRSFDDTGPEYMQSTFRVPADIDTSGTVTFEIVGSAATAASSKNVKFTFDFVQVAADGLLTGAYGSAETWDDQSISGTQDDQDIISNTETVSNLGWVAGREVYYRLYRGAATTNNLSGDYDVIAFNIRIPRA